MSTAYCSRVFIVLYSDYFTLTTSSVFVFAAGDIQSSDDVIKYFTMHGHGAVKKLFYLNKAAGGCRHSHCHSLCERLPPVPIPYSKKFHLDRSQGSMVS